VILLAGFIKVDKIEGMILLGAFVNRACLFPNVIACISDDYCVYKLKKQTNRLNHPFNELIIRISIFEHFYVL